MVVRSTWTRFVLCLLLGAPRVAAQPAGEAAATAVPQTPPDPPAAPTPAAPLPTAPATAPVATDPAQAPAPQPAPAPAPQPAPASAPQVVAVPPGWALVPIAPPPLAPPSPKPRRLEQDQRHFTIGVGPLFLGNVHWLDQLDDKSVTVGTRRGTDDRYPGFVGADATVGLMLDLRYQHFIGIEIDLFRQNDRGTGVITLRDAGSICLVPSVAVPYESRRFEVTIGQTAWHLPLLFKLTIPGRRVVVQDKEVDREIRKWFTSFAFGPEFVFPGSASLDVSPDYGLDYPLRATVSRYVMFTGAFGVERRISDAHDVRFLFSLRGSYHPGAGSSAMQRGKYELVDTSIVPIAYNSAWRYQAALTLGLGWFI